MTYTIELGDKAPRFENLLSTDGSFYSIDEFNNKPLKVIFFTCNHCPYVTGSDELTRAVDIDPRDPIIGMTLYSNARSLTADETFCPIFGAIEFNPTKAD